MVNGATLDAFSQVRPIGYRGTGTPIGRPARRGMEKTGNAINVGPLSDRDFMKVSRALADPRRYAMLAAIAACDGPCPCTTLTGMQDVSAATISHHVKELEKAGLITTRRAGKFVNLAFQRPLFDAYLARLSAL